MNNNAVIQSGMASIVQMMTQNSVTVNNSQHENNDLGTNNSDS